MLLLNNTPYYSSPVNIQKGWHVKHPSKGAKLGGTTLIFTHPTVNAGATLYFHTELQGRFQIFRIETLTTRFLSGMLPTCTSPLPSQILYMLTIVQRKSFCQVLHQNKQLTQTNIFDIIVYNKSTLVDLGWSQDPGPPSSGEFPRYFSISLQKDSYYV